MAALNLVPPKLDDSGLPALVRLHQQRNDQPVPSKERHNGWHICPSLLLLASLDAFILAALGAFGAFCFRH